MEKAALTLFLAVFGCISTVAQSPQSFNYQTIARDGTGNILSEKQISVKISLLQASPEGAAVYCESHKTLTNSFGLFTLKIGRGNALKGDFSSLKWHKNSHYIRIELDSEGGEDYQMMGTSELLSVPYALYAEHSGDGSRSNDYDWGRYFNNLFTGTGGNYPSGNVGIGLTTPQSKLQVEGDILAREIRSISTDETSSSRVVNNKIITTYAPETQASVNATCFQIKAATEDATHSIGNTNQINGMKFTFIHRNNGSLNDFYGIRSQGGMPNGSWGGTGSTGSITNLAGLRSELYGQIGSITYANNISLIKVGENFSNYCYLQIGSIAEVNGNYGIYNAAANPNYFAGNTGFGNTNPLAVLHVTGNALIQPSASSSSKIEIENTNNAEIVMYDESGTASSKLTSQGTSYFTNGNLVIGNTTVDSSAALEINSNTKGLLSPRMTMAQRDNIGNPATGLMIYQTDTNAGYYFYEGNQWEAISSGELGLDDLTDAGTDASSLFLGQGSGDMDDGANQNTAAGLNALHANTTEENNLAAGYRAMENNKQGANNAALGSTALYLNTSGTNNVAIGSGSGYNMQGDNNTLIGAMAGNSLESDSGNVFIGYGSGATLNCSNKLIINNNTSSSPFIYGDFYQGYLNIGGDLSVEGSTYVALSSGNLGVGTTVPTEKLEVNGNILADTLSAETIYAGAFSSNSPLKLQTNNTTRIYVDDSEGKVGIGTTAPNASAAVDVSSISKGFLPPRMTTSERDNISTPEPGLMVYNTDLLCINFYNGHYWAYIGYDSTLCGIPFTDPRDGNIYQTVRIGDHCWMAENLRAIVYPNGDAIPKVTGNSAWVALGDNNTDDAYCYYNNNSNNECGALYTYAAAIADNWQRDNINGQGICPDGWHLPSDDEWKILEGNVDTQYPVGDPEWDGSDCRGYDAGTHLKSTSGWNRGGNGDNSSGFVALPCGGRNGFQGSFFFAGDYGYWWSATEYGSYRAWFRRLSYYYASVNRYGSSKSNGFPVRCLRDD